MQTTSSGPTGGAPGGGGPTSALVHAGEERASERGAGVVEWLGISALSIAMLATIFTALNSVGLDLVDYIRQTLGL